MRCGAHRGGPKGTINKLILINRRRRRRPMTMTTAGLRITGKVPTRKVQRKVGIPGSSALFLLLLLHIDGYDDDDDALCRDADGDCI